MDMDEEANDEPTQATDDPGSDDAPALKPDAGGHEEARADASPIEPGRWHPAALLRGDGREPSPHLDEDLAQSTWAAASALWHPAILARCATLPRLEDAEFPTHPDRDELRVVVAGSWWSLPSGYTLQASDIGAILVEGSSDRQAIVRELLSRMDGGEPAEPEPRFDALALDFLALGTARRWLRDLTLAMAHPDGLDLDSLTREALAGARAWRDGDEATASGRLRACFELLTQARERFYPVDAYAVDMVLLDPGAASGTLAKCLESSAPFTLIAPARAIEMQAARDPDGVRALCQAIDDGRADVIGGPYGEADEPLRPVESVLWQLREGHNTYRRHLDDRAVETFARRRFGLYPQLPQFARRFGFRFALHMGLDDGRFPVPPESKRLWEGPDSSTLESITRLPVAADRPSEGLRLPWRLGRSMKDDHVATVLFVHWPEPVADWFADLRRVAAYSPVLARLVTVNDFFHLTDRPWEMFQPAPDETVLPYLAQATARGETGAITRRVAQTALRLRVDGLIGLSAMARALGVVSSELDNSSIVEVEGAAESNRIDEANARLDAMVPVWAEAVARAIADPSAPLPHDTEAGPGAQAGRPGLMVLNPLGVPRRVPVTLPASSPIPATNGPVLAAQLTDKGVEAIVEVPAFGFAFVPTQARDGDDPTVPAGTASADGRTLRTASMVVEIDEATGGLRGLRAPGEPAARIGQMIVVTGLTGEDGQTAASRMVGERFEVDLAGPAVVRAWSEGSVKDASDRVLARFRQTVRVWSSRPTLDLEIELSDIDPSLAAEMSAIGLDPWSRYIGCRWAWPDAEALLKRSIHMAPMPTTAMRPETPDAFEILTRRQQTTVLFGGLAHHRRHGARMLDTLLIAGGETSRRFRLGLSLDQAYPFHAAIDRIAPVLTVPVAAGPPASGPSGWLIQCDTPNVAVTRVEPLENSGDGRGWGLALHLLETSGRPTRARLRFPKNPTWGRQTDFLGDLLLDLTVDGDSVLIDLTPHELARLDVTLG
jgi:alpha-mannosidase